MDDNMEVDDLFGDSAMDAAAMDIPMPMSMPNLIKGLPQRLHELHTSGCSQLIAWSKSGCLAYVEPDGMSIKMAFLSCNANKDNSWALRDDANSDRTIRFDGKHPIVHLSWGPMMTELAVVDAAGRIGMISCSYMALNSATVLRAPTDDQENDLNQPVGMYWLNRERPIGWYLPISKENNWTYIPTKRQPFGPYAHLALAMVTKSGNLRLLYHQVNGVWKSSTSTLTKMSSTGEMVTHAAIGSMKDGSLILAMQTSDRKLHIFRVRIDFVQEKGQPENVKQANIVVENVRGNVACGVFKDQSAVLLGEAHMPAYSTMNLTHLEIIQTSDIERTQQSAPMILAVYSNSLNSMGFSQFTHGAPCIVARWQLQLSEQKLHSSFDEIGAKTGEMKPKKKIDINRLEDTHLSQVVTSVQQLDPGSTAFVLGDGTIQIYDPITMADLHQHQELGKASTLSKAGFAFQNLDAELGGLHAALSPNGCIATVVDAAGKLHCRDVGLWQATQDGDDQQLGVETAVNALCLTFTRACLNSNATDDVLKIVLEQFPAHQTTFLENIYRVLFTDADFTSGLDALAKKQFIPKVLSIQAAFGYGPQRNVSSAFCWTTLNIRHISLHLLLILTYLRQRGGVEYRDPDLLSSVLHNINYAQSLFAYLINNLFEMAYPTFPTPPASPTTTEPPHAELTTLLLLSSWSRFFLRHLSRALRGLVYIPHSSGSALNAKALPAFTRIAREIDPDPSLGAKDSSKDNQPTEPSSPIKMEAVERLLATIEKYVIAAYESAGMKDNDAARATVERQMLSQAKVPDILKGVMPRVIKEALPVSRNEVNRLDVWEGEYSWLGIWSQAKPNIDVHKKRKMRSSDKTDRKIRRCVRCGEVSEDLVPGRGLPPYFRQQIGRCVCEASFYVDRMGS